MSVVGSSFRLVRCSFSFKFYHRHSFSIHAYIPFTLPLTWLSHYNHAELQFDVQSFSVPPFMWLNALSRTIVQTNFDITGSPWNFFPSLCSSFWIVVLNRSMTWSWNAAWILAMRFPHLNSNLSTCFNDIVSIFVQLCWLLNTLSLVPLYIRIVEKTNLSLNYSTCENQWKKFSVCVHPVHGLCFNSIRTPCVSSAFWLGHE